LKLKNLFGKKQKQEHKIMQQIERRGHELQPEYHRATPECPHPERWSMYDSMTDEVEILEFLRTLVTTIKPDLVVETGTFLGISTLWIAEALKANGFGRVITCEYDPQVFAKAKERIAGSGLSEWIECRNESSLEVKVNGRIDLLFSDSDMSVREQEVRHFLPLINTNGVILMHDASSHLKVVRQSALKLEAEGLLSVLFLPTPRGLVMAQKRELLERTGDKDASGASAQADARQGEGHRVPLAERSLGGIIQPY
jgi:predicted O-methyltransferase YrrM